MGFVFSYHPPYQRKHDPDRYQVAPSPVELLGEGVVVHGAKLDRITHLLDHVIEVQVFTVSRAEEEVAVNSLAVQEQLMVSVVARSCLNLTNVRLRQTGGLR